MSKPVQFVGIYKDEFENFIKYRKSLGYKYGIAKEREFFRLNIHLNSYGGGAGRGRGGTVRR